MKNKIVKIGTRGSKLALTQAGILQQVIKENFKDILAELVVIKTKGDKIINSPLSQIGDKGLFTKELEEALVDKRIDIAVHSLKDLPTELPEGVELGAVLKRSEVKDVLVNKNGIKLDDLADNATIATSSLRRRSQLLNYKRTFNLIDIRGNVDTRLRKLEENYCDSLCLAGAGLIRLGLSERITEFLDPEVIMPAACQGIIGLEIRKNDPVIQDIVKQINHQDTFISAEAERTFLKTLEGGCQVPIGCLTVFENDLFTIKGFIADLEGKKIIKNQCSGPVNNAREIAISLAQALLNDGGKQILETIRDKNE